MKSEYIDLDREFLDLRNQRSSEDEVWWTYFSGGGGKGIRWPELLESKVAVVLGEAGSGKTWELRAQAKKLRRLQEDAFFVPLDALVDRSVDAVLSSADLRRYVLWSRHSGKATFFLDSVDESRLRGFRAFSEALRSFERSLGANIDRARVVITSRVSEWRGSSDLRLVAEHLHIPLTQHKEDEVPLIRVVSIRPLDSERVARLAEHLGLTDLAAFMADVEYANAHAFVGRPKDVVNLVAYWKERGRLGTLSDIVEYDVRKKLEESVERKDTLTLKQLREGVSSLAAAATFCRSLNFFIPEDAAEPDVIVGALDARQVLPTWSPVDVQALLGRAIFDESTYGRIRFHHRTTVEYLAAEWIKARLASGCNYRVIEDLLLVDRHGRTVSVPPLEPVTAWLCLGDEIWNRRLRDRVLVCNPDLLIKYGDPQSLSVDVRRTLLHSIVQRYRGRKLVRIETDAAQLRRIADRRLANDIQKYITDEFISSDIRELFIRIAIHGRMSECVEAALGIVKAKRFRGDLYALSALAVELIGAVGTPSDGRQMYDSLRNENDIPEWVGIRLCEALYPKSVEVRELVDLLGRLETPKRLSASSLRQELADHLRTVTPEKDLVGLLTSLVQLAQSKPWSELGGGERQIPLSEKHYWFGALLHAIATRILNRKELDAEACDAVGDAIWLLRFCRMVDNFHARELSLHEQSERHPQVRRRYVTRCHADITARRKSEALWRDEVFDEYAPIRPSLVDAEWLIADIENSSEERARATLLLATEIWFQLNRPQALRAAVFRSVRGRARLARLAKQRMPSALRIQYDRLRYAVRRLGLGKARQIRWWVKKQFSRRLWIARMWLRAERLRSAQASGWLYGILEECRSGRDESRPLDKAALRSRFGVRVANAAWEGFMRAWRAYEPESWGRREHGGPLQISIRVPVGLAGLSAELSNPERVASLSDQDAQLAVRYAINELGKLPAWLVQLARAKPDAVREQLAVLLRASWRKDESPSTLDLIGRIQRAGEPLSVLLRGEVAQLLEGADPGSAEVLNQAIGFLLGASKEFHALLAQLARQRIDNYSFPDRFFMIWLVVWLSLEAIRALEYMGDWIAKNPEHGDEFIVAIALCLCHRRQHNIPQIKNPSYLSVGALQQFIPLIFSHVRPADDIDRAGQGVYTPTPRDDAQHFRDSLVRALAESSDSAAFSAIRRLIDHPAMSSEREWLFVLLDQRAARDGETAPWKESDIPDFEAHYETTPRCADSLFKLAVRRIAEIKDLVEADDYSKREEVARTAPESTLQVWVAGQLNSLARGRYTVVREPEVDLKKKPDIRLVTLGIEPTTIEVKWAHKWSYEELRNALYDQLVRHYMRSNNSRHGILLLCNYENSRSWILPSGPGDFKALVSQLQSEAGSILNTNTAVDGLAVLGIAFYPVN